MNEPRIMGSLTPRQIVAELDKYIVGQSEAKRAVAVALRNRWRRLQVPENLQDEITPKNIIMIGSTGVGKTEIARRLAKLAEAPFVKVEATKFTEVGYVGRDVDSMIRDLVETSVQMVRREEEQNVQEKARHLAEERLLDILLPPPPVVSKPSPEPSKPMFKDDGSVSLDLGIFQNAFSESDDPDRSEQERLEEERRLEEARASHQSTREKFRVMLREGRLDDREVELEVAQNNNPMLEIYSNSGMEEMGIQLQDMMGNLFGNKRKKKRKMKVREALPILIAAEAAKLIDMEKVQRSAIDRAEHAGIVFLDEIDKIAGREGGKGPDVSREGVQRDILPVVEGSTVSTKYGPVKTDHVLFIASGAFHVSKPSDLIPELQGRFPIRVELKSLNKDDFYRILKEPHNSLIHQYTEMIRTEGVNLVWTDEALVKLAEVADDVNQKAENIGARRLHTIIERVLDEVSFESPDMGTGEIVITEAYVLQRLKDVLEDRDLSHYIL